MRRVVRAVRSRPLRWFARDFPPSLMPAQPHARPSLLPAAGFRLSEPFSCRGVPLARTSARPDLARCGLLFDRGPSVRPMLPQKKRPATHGCRPFSSGKTLPSRDSDPAGQISCERSVLWTPSTARPEGSLQLANDLSQASASAVLHATDGIDGTHCAAVCEGKCSSKIER